MDDPRIADGAGGTEPSRIEVIEAAKRRCQSDTFRPHPGGRVASGRGAAFRPVGRGNRGDCHDPSIPKLCQSLYHPTIPPRKPFIYLYYLYYLV